MINKYKRTNIFVIDEKLWAWARYRAVVLGCTSTSEYIFDLIKLDKEGKLDLEIKFPKEPLKIPRPYRPKQTGKENTA